MRPDPQPGPKQVRIAVEYASICGSDLSLQDWGDPWVRSHVAVGTIIGHEVSGVIDRIGADVSDSRLGEDVTVESHVPCRTCAQCLRNREHVCPGAALYGFTLPGGLADYMVVDEPQLRTIPGLRLKDLCLMDPLGNAQHAVTLGNPSPGQRVAIVGCGPIGLMICALLTRSHFAPLVCDMQGYRTDLATRMGSTPLDFHNDRAACEVVFECTGTEQGILTALDLTAPGGILVAVGLPSSSITLNWADQLVLAEITIKGMTGRIFDQTWTDLETMAQTDARWLRDTLSMIVTHEYAMSDFSQAIDTAMGRACGKVRIRVGAA